MIIWHFKSFVFCTFMKKLSYLHCIKIPPVWAPDLSHQKNLSVG